MSAKSSITLKIEKLAIGGSGIARHDGLVIFVPDSAPGDELEVELTTVKKNFAEGHILRIIKAGPGRRTPPCPYADRCGGCNWQHLTEEEQRHQKELLVLETLKKFNPGLEFIYHAIKESPRSLRYRNRIQPKFHKGQFGFFARNSHDIVEIRDCLITEEVLTSQFSEVKAWASNLSAKDLLRLEMYISADNKVHYGQITDEDEGIGFSQVNRFQNIDLIQTVMNWAQGNFSHVFDLYAGSGNFTFPLSQLFPNTPVTAVELSPKLVTRARLQIKSARIQYYLSDVEAYLKRALVKPNDLVVLDPPRAGTSEYIMRALAAAGPQKIIYISCHPVSLARDLKWFFEWAKKLGRPYKLVQAQAFEMFPQTDHVETIVELRVDS